MELDVLIALLQRLRRIVGGKAKISFWYWTRERICRFDIDPDYANRSQEDLSGDIAERTGDVELRVMDQPKPNVIDPVRGCKYCLKPETECECSDQDVLPEGGAS